jgi:hypothetical protein
MTESNESNEFNMEDLEEGLSYWDIDPPDEVKARMLEMLNVTTSPQAMDLGKEFTLDAMRILQSSHDDSELFMRSLQVPGFTAAVAHHESTFANFLSDTLGLDFIGDNGMPPKEVAKVIVMGVEIAMVLGFMAGQAVKREVALDSLWGSSPATKEQVAEVEAQRESNEGLEGLTFEEIDHSQLGGDCMECDFHFENVREFTKHMLTNHTGF